MNDLEKDLDHLTDQELQSLYDSTILLQTELNFFKRYTAYALPTFQPHEEHTADQTSSSNNKHDNDISPKGKLSIGEKLRLVSKLDEIIELKGNTTQSSRLLQQLECEIDVEREFVPFAIGSNEGPVSEPEMWRKHMELEMKRKDLVIEKLRLQKSQTAKNLAKMKQLVNDAGTGGGLQQNLSIVDFDQLTIENQQYQQSIQELNQLLRQVKLSSSQMVSRLNKLKKELQEQTQEHEHLTKDWQAKSQILGKLQTEVAVLERDLSAIGNSNDQLKHQMQSFKTPEIADYIDCCQKIRQLTLAKQQYQRKLQLIQSTASKSTSKSSRE